MLNIEPKCQRRVEVAVGVVKDSKGRILIARRNQYAHQGGLWEFPGGKLEFGESALQALSRELFEEVGINVVSAVPLIRVSFDYSDVKVRLNVYEVLDFKGQSLDREGQELKWVLMDELNRFDFPAANKSIIKAIQLGGDYPIISEGNGPQALLSLQHIVRQGVALVQFRIKGLTGSETEKLMIELRKECKAAGVAYLVNSAMSVKLEEMDGLHLTSADLMALAKRPDIKGMLSASCHNIDELQKAEQLGVDFVVLSPVKKTTSHPNSEPMGWELFGQLVDKINTPVFALGGLNKKDYLQAKSCGAQGLSGISLYRQKEICKS